jgi:hypothetical protein
MNTPHEDRIDPHRPGLIVLYGSTKRKFRPLEGDLVVLGRTAGCDIGLVSPEVAPVHCVLFRVEEGWRIRDCSGRATRVNGTSIHDEPLRNGDTIQIGTFSFEAQLPAESRGYVSAPKPNRPSAQGLLPEPAYEFQKLMNSRRRLGELALNLRRKLREQAGERAEVAQKQTELEQMERRLRKAHEEQMAKNGALTKRAEELDHYAAHLKREAAKIPDEATTAGMKAELASLQAELQAREAELEARRAELAKERQEAIKARIELEKLRDQQGEQTPSPASTRDTHFDVVPGDRFESARRLLRELAERRKSSYQGLRPSEPRAK